MRFPRIIYLWSAILVVVIFADLVMYWGGYHGKLNTLSLWGVKACLVLTAFILVIVNWARYVKERRYVVLGTGVLVCLILASNILVMDGYRSPFFLGAKSRITREVDPNQLQAWAEAVLDGAHEEVTYIHSRDIPAFLKLPGWPLRGASIRRVGATKFLEVRWGSGMAGSYGFVVGPPDFVSPSGVFWRPGIYLYTRK
jgi:hypothetical protein